MKKNQKKDEAELERIKRARLWGELIEEDDLDEDWAPEPILTCMFLNDGSDRFYITAVGQYAGLYYICDLEQEWPLKAVEFQKGLIINYLKLSPKSDFIIGGCKNGEVFIWSLESDKKVLRIRNHDGMRGMITTAQLSRWQNYLLTTGRDGILINYLFNEEAIKMDA